MDVLRGDRDLGPRERLDGGCERDVRRADDDVHRAEVGLAKRAAELARLGRPLEHLPVAGDEHVRLCRDRCHARELLALEQLERGAAAGGDPRDAVGDAGLVDGAHRVAAADDREAVAVGDRPRDRERALGEARPLEDAHRAVPEDRLRGRDRGREDSSRSPARCRGRASRPGPRRRTARPASRRLATNASAATTSRREHHGSNGNGFSARTSSAILPPISTRSAREPRFVSTADLVLDLRAAGDDHERPLDLAEQARRGARARRAAAGRRTPAAGARRASVEECARCAEPKASLT